jgi:hypothetical protein
MPVILATLYLGGRDQEDGSSKPAQASSSRGLISKIPKSKKGWWSGSVPQKKKKRKKKKKKRKVFNQSCPSWKPR